MHTIRELSEICSLILVMNDYYIENNNEYVEPSEDDFDEIYDEILLDLENKSYGKHYRKFFGEFSEISVNRGCKGQPNHIKLQLYHSPEQCPDDIARTAINKWNTFKWAEGTSFRIDNS